jgi:flagellar hook assembly protein FlgD
VTILVDREESAGSHTVSWDGTTSNGQPAATGLYLYRLQAGDYVETKRMLLLK